MFKRKGRPPNALREARWVGNVAADSRRLTGDANLLNPSDRPSMGYSLEAAQITSHTLGAQSLVELSHSESPSLSPNSRRKHNHNLNMAEYLDPADRVDQTRDPWFSNGPARRSARYSPEEESDTRARERDDPVSLHALSAVEASSLVALFHERMNPLVAVLDPHCELYPSVLIQCIRWRTCGARLPSSSRRSLPPQQDSSASTCAQRSSPMPGRCSIAHCKLGPRTSGSSRAS